VQSSDAGTKVVSETFGYTEELIFVPAEANVGLSYGAAPISATDLKPDRVFMELCSGLNVFLPSKMVGRATGIDNASMIDSGASEHRSGRRHQRRVSSVASTIPLSELRSG